MQFKPITTEKTVKLVELENTLIFEVGRQERKKEIKQELEKIFNIKIEKIRSLIRNNRKFVYVRVDKKHPAIDVATKMGMI